MVDSKKILIDARMISNQVHGIGRYTYDLIHGLNELGHRISVIVCDKSHVETLGPISVRDVQICPIKFASIGESLALSQLNTSTYDIAHFPSFAVPLWAQWEKVIITIHDLIHLHEKGNPLHQIYYKTVVGPALRKCKKVIAVSEWTKKELNQKLGIPLAHIQVVRNGLDSKEFFAKNVTQENSFISLSNLKNHKNIFTLIRACRDLWAEGLDFRLYLSLSGKQIPERWNLTDFEKSKITILLSAPDSQIKDLILRSKAMISTSLLEGFNYPAAEALALGKRAIVSRSSANVELKGENLIFYGEPLDVYSLKLQMKNVLELPCPPSAHHQIDSSLFMAQKTMDAYFSS